MRHRKKKIHLGRKLGHRKMLLKNLATSFILYEDIETTPAKAKILRSYVEKLITLAKADTVAHRRIALNRLTHKNAVKKLFEVLGPRYNARSGGYARIRRLGTRAGDTAPLVKISLV